MIEKIVGFCCGRPRLILWLTLVATIAAGAYTVTHFQIDTNSEKLVTAKAHWRRHEVHYDTLFPQQSHLILVVVDGQTAERAEFGAATLAAKLRLRNDQFLLVRRPDGGEFFNRNGLLFLSLGDVRANTQELIQAQPFLGAIASDPSLRGIMDSLNLMLDGVAHGQAKLSDMKRPIAGIGATLNDAASGKKNYLGWEALVTGNGPASTDTRRFIEVRPKLDYTALEPGQDAESVIRETARSANLTPENGIRVRLTGPVPLADEEFASLKENSDLMLGAMFLAVLATLWLAVRSVRIIFAILMTLLAGLALTMGVGLAVVGVFNIVSIAFIALFVGLGVDFAIQFSVRYRAARFEEADLVEALKLTARRVGTPLALAAGATAAAFLSFLPTNYVGVAELGLVAGMGMVIAFLLSITFLPALLRLMNLRGEPERIGFAMFAPVERFLKRNRPFVLQVAAGLTVGAIALTPGLRFDFNPLDLRNPRTESVSTLNDLMKNPQTTPNTIDVLAPNLDAAGAMAARIAKLPEVGQTLTLKSFIPDDQDAKLALIRDANTLLDPTLNPFAVKPPPSDAETVQSMKLASARLRQAVSTDTSGAGKEALALASALDRVAAGAAADRARATDALISGLDTMLDEVRASLTAEPVALTTLPKDFARDWVAPDGTARIQVFPKNGAPDNAALAKFSDAVLAVAPDATGAPVSIQNYGKTILRAFIQAGFASTIAITLLLLVVLRNVRDVILTLVPLLLTGLLTLATCSLIGLNLNFANVIALPLLLGVGVAFDIYYIVAWRNGVTSLLPTALTRAVIFSALTTATGFGTLWLSNHPGTASMGELLMISLGWTLATTLFFLPALLDERPPAPAPA